MQWLRALRFVGGWLWATALLVAAAAIIGRSDELVAAPLALAAFTAGLGVGWAMVANPLCTRRLRWLTRTVEAATAIVFFTSIVWSTWLVTAT